MGEAFSNRETYKAPINFGDLVDSSISEKKGKFYEFKGSSDKVVRIETFDELFEKHGGKIEIPELVDSARKLYQELNERYSIPVSVDFTLGKGEKGEDVVYAVVDKIEGSSLQDAKTSEEFINKLQKLYASVARYFSDKFREGGLYVWDINGESQYVYGKRKDDTEDHVYLVDTDIWLSKNRNDLYLSVYWLARHMSCLEHSFGIKFEEARTIISEFLKQPLPKEADELVRRNFDETNMYLNDKKSDYEPKTAIPRFE